MNNSFLLSVVEVSFSVGNRCLRQVIGSQLCRLSYVGIAIQMLSHSVRQVISGVKTASWKPIYIYIYIYVCVCVCVLRITAYRK
jgi:hypothetical protein